MGYPMASLSRQVISQSSYPFFGAMTLRTSWMRRSALVNVPFFSRNVEPGRNTCAIVRSLVQEQVLHDDAFHGREAGGDVVRIRVGLKDVLALDINAFERAIDRGVEHVGNAQARLACSSGSPHIASEHLHASHRSKMCR